MAKYSDDEVRAALQGRMALARYPFPGKPEIEVGIRLLPDGELDRIRAEAQRAVKRDKIDVLIDPEYFDRLVHRETISRAFFDVEKPDEPFFGSQTEVAELDGLLVRSLYELYVLHHQAMDPLKYCPEDERDALVERLGKSESAAGILSLYDLPTARAFVLSLASRVRELQQTLKSSTG